MHLPLPRSVAVSLHKVRSSQPLSFSVQRAVLTAEFVFFCKSLGRHLARHSLHLLHSGRLCRHHRVQGNAHSLCIVSSLRAHKTSCDYPFFFFSRGLFGVVFCSNRRLSRSRMRSTFCPCRGRRVPRSLRCLCRVLSRCSSARCLLYFSVCYDWYHAAQRKGVCAQRGGLCGGKS
jgi:hypothetical protein